MKKETKQQNSTDTQMGGKFISTIGNVSAETIKKYIEDQKGT